jgi:hypothetical protein
MKEISEQDQEGLLAILRRHEQELGAYAGVHYVDVGYKFVNGKPTNQLAIRVHVGEKKPERELEPLQILPRSIEGLAVDVIQSNPGLEHVDPLVGGVEVGRNFSLAGGTLGVVAFDATSSAPMGLSNHHVLVGVDGQVGDVITQPASVAAVDVIGTLTRWNRDLDCAVCTLNNFRLISQAIRGFPMGVTRPWPPVVGMAVAKSGQRTGITFGIVDGVGTDQFTIMPDPDNPSPNGEISKHGDSGSVWLEVGTTNAVGLHFAGETDPNPAAERAWAKRMIKVVSALNISLSPPIPFITLQPGVYAIQQKSNNRFVDAHEIEGKDFALVTRPAQNNDTQRWYLIPVGIVCTIQQASNRRFVDAYQSAGNDYALVTRNANNDDSQCWILKPLGFDTFTIQQMSSRRFVDGHESVEKDFALVTRPEQNDKTQRWTLTSIGDKCTIKQVSSFRFMDAHEIVSKDFALVTRPEQQNDTQRWYLIPVGVECTIQQVSTGRFVDAYQSAGKDFALVTRAAKDNDTQRWIVKSLGGSMYTLQHKVTGRFMDAHEIVEKDFALVTRPAQDNDTQRWLIKPV